MAVGLTRWRCSCLRRDASTYGLVGCVSTESHFIRGAKASLVWYFASGGDRFFRLLHIKQNLVAVCVPALGCGCLALVYQVGHGTGLVGWTFAFALNWGVPEFVKEVLLVVCFCLRLKRVVVYLSWNEFGHLIWSSFGRESAYFIAHGWLRLVIAGKGGVRNTDPHMIPSSSIGIAISTVARSWSWWSWLYLLLGRNYLVICCTHDLRIKHINLLPILFLLPSTSLWLIASSCVATSISALTHLIIRGSLQRSL